MKKFAPLLLSIILLGTIACAHVYPTEPPKKDNKPAKENVVTKVWFKTLNPLYNREWSPWKKFVYWIGPGH